MRLADLVAAAEGVRIRAVGPDRDPDLVAVVHDTRAVVAGALFCCVRGTHVDGHDLAPAAVASGAAALLVDHELPLDVPQLVVDGRPGRPGARRRRVLGPPVPPPRRRRRDRDVGKTTVTHLLAAVLSAAGRPCGVIGTLSGARTTPEAPELQALLADHRRQGDAAVAMEVSSHGLDQARVGATRFAAAAVHQPVPGSPRLSRLDGGVLPGQGPPVHARVHRPRRRVRRRAVGPPAGRRDRGRGPHRAAPLLPRRRHPTRPDAVRGHVPLAGRGRDAGAGRAVQRPQRRRGGRRGGGRRSRPGRHRPRAVAGRAGARAVRGRRRRAAVHGAGRLRPQARRARAGARLPPASWSRGRAG